MILVFKSLRISERSIRKVIARARREAHKALKYHIKGMVWVDEVIVDTHLKIFSDDYLKYFWSHLAAACSLLRPLTGEVHPVAGSMKVSLPH